MEEERRLYFDISPTERGLVDSVYTISVAVSPDTSDRLFKPSASFTSERLGQQEVIFNLFDYQLCDAGAKSELEHKTQRVAMLSTQPIFILRGALQYLTISASSP